MSVTKCDIVYVTKNANPNICGPAMIVRQNPHGGLWLVIEQGGNQWKVSYHDIVGLNRYWWQKLEMIWNGLWSSSDLRMEYAEGARKRAIAKLRPWIDWGVSRNWLVEYDDGRVYCWDIAKSMNLLTTKPVVR
jgi:hypothetical protein